MKAVKMGTLMLYVTEELALNQTWMKAICFTQPVNFGG